ncbi:MAG: lipoyl(octanoyl) transferase LipB [bacterium]
MAARAVLAASWLGRVAYGEALELQREAARARAAGTSPDRLLLLEHDDVITIGRASRDGHVLIAPEAAQRAGVAIVESDRGGDVTYHGPGQLVGYPIIQLALERRDLHRYVRDVEAALIAALAEFGIAARARAGLTGVWVGNEKIASIGVRVSRWVTSHGFALNVATDLDRFRWIVPCGIDGCRMTSVARAAAGSGAGALTAAEVAPVIARAFAERFDLALAWEALCPA